MSLRQFDLYFNEKVQMAYISPLMKIIVVYRVDMCNQCDMGYFSFKNYFLVFFSIFDVYFIHKSKIGAVFFIYAEYSW